MAESLRGNKLALTGSLSFESYSNKKSDRAMLKTIQNTLARNPL
jgi:hypothetical protein